MKQRYQVFLIAVLTIVTTYYLLDVGEWMYTMLPGDTPTYIAAAELLYDDLSPHPTRPLGVAVLMGLPKLVIPDLSPAGYLRFGVVLNLLAWFGSLLLYYRALRLFLAKRVAGLATLPFVFGLTSLVSIFVLLSELLAMLVFSAVTYQLVKYHRTKNSNHLLLAAVLLNGASLIRPGLVYIGLIASAGVVVLVLWRRAKHRSSSPFGSPPGLRLRTGVIALLLASLLGLAGQNYAIYRAYGVAKTSFIGSLTWYYYLGAAAQADVDNTTALAVQRSRRQQTTGLSYPAIDQLSTEDLRRQLGSHPGVIVRQWALNVVRSGIAGSAVLRRLSEASEGPTSLSYLLYQVSRWQNIVMSVVLGACGLLVASRPRRYGGAEYLLLLLIAYVVVTSGISFWQNDRFHFVLHQPIVVLFLLLLRGRVNDRGGTTPPW